MRRKILEIFSLVFAMAVIFVAIWLFHGKTFSKKQIRGVVLISIDTCRADYLGCYGYKRKITPNIDTIAKEAVVFENVISPVPLTLPAHSSMLTGTIPPYHCVHDNADYVLGKSNVTLAEILKEKGFFTAAVVSSFVLDSRFGLNQGFEDYLDRFEEDLSSQGVPERRAAETSKYANSWLEKHTGDRFFLFIHYYDPHTEYEPPEPFKSSYADNLYAGEIAYTDYCIGQVVEKLKELGLYDSTLVIVTGDHGEMLGEHGESTHGYFIYHSAVKVPLIIKLPGWTKSRKVNDIAGLVDIVPTVCSILDIQVPSQVQGKDLSVYFGRRRYADRDRYLYCGNLAPSTKYGANTLLGVIDGHFKYIQTTRQELYDLIDDPNESDNLLDAQPQRGRVMQDELRQILERQVRDISDNKANLNAKSMAILQSLGYVASGSTEQSFEFNQSKTDPKDLIELHELNSEAVVRLSQKRYSQVQQLCERMLQTHPDFAMPYRYLGKIAYEQADDANSVYYYSQYIELDPNQSEVLSALGLAQFRMGNHDGALKSFARALEINPDSVEANYNMATGLARMGNFEAASSYFLKVLQLDPDEAGACRGLGHIFFSRGKLMDAGDYFAKALQINPNDAESHYNIVVILERYGKYELAIPHLNEVLRIQPNDVEARIVLARIFFRQHQIHETLRLYREILQIVPDHVDVLNAVAWVLAATEDEKIRNPAEALKFAERACELTDYEVPEILDTLAICYAGVGKFGDAIKTAEKAIRLADSAGKKELTEDIRSKLKLYKKGQVYKESVVPKK